MKSALHQHRLVQHVFVLIVDGSFVYYLDFYEIHHQVNEPKVKKIEKEKWIKWVLTFSSSSFSFAFFA
jgi:phosphate/sulfate permease